MSPDDATRYQLPVEENRRIFGMDIVPDLLTGPIAQDPATAVFLLGQPGAGKTWVAQLIAERLDARGGFVDVDSDLYKPYHPQYARLMAEDDRLMTFYTGPDGRAWMQQAQQFVRGEDPLSGGQKLNALVQEIAMNPQYLAETMRSYRDVGTRIDAFVLAVSQALSEQGVLNRYHEQVRDRGQGRLTVPEKALASYTGIPDSCELIVREGLADFAAVYRRGDSDPRFAADAVELARDPLALRQSVERERNRPWTPEESRDFLSVQRKLREGLPADFGPQLDRIDQLAAPLLTAPGPSTSRISAAAARSRSTTTPKNPATPGKSPAPERTPPHHRPEGPEQRQGRTK
ncbi:zeta toxin family protein [Streptomyces anulatus]|uniref:zeta toxin family protein n=1 Tax=Streptomyces anulatus TaxID=1892 RepID=UPI002E109E66|nr:zeta toxin family protein [Streptomyces anulatus]WSR81137.1 zeta toxin family protein [Streptomyces anulatus]